jgi:hypothetical protein
MAKGYVEGPAAEAAEARLELLERGEGEDPDLHQEQPAVYGSTKDNPDKHFLGWLGEVDPDDLFESGKAYGLSVVRRRP